MRLEIDTTAKTIVLKSPLKLSEIDELKTLIGADFDKYTIVSDVAQPYYYGNPLYVPAIGYYETTCMGDFLLSTTTNCASGGITDATFKTNPSTFTTNLN